MPQLKKARSLIAEYGKPVELEYIHSATSRGRETGMILQQMMKNIGVKVNPVSSDFPGILKKMFSRKFDIASWFTIGSYDMGPITMAQLHSESPWNVTRYANEEVDRLLIKQRLSTAPEVRKEILCTIARTVNSDTPFIYLFGRKFYLFAKNNVKNVTLQVLGEEGIKLADIWIDQ